MKRSEHNTNQASKQKAFLIFTRIIAFVPLILGLDLGVFGFYGLTIQWVHNYHGLVVPELDSSFRFLGLQFLGTGLILLWCVQNIEERRVPFRIIAISFVLGGLTRLVSRVITGVPHIFISLVNLLEVLSGLVLLIWHWRIVHRQ